MIRLAKNWSMLLALALLAMWVASARGEAGSDEQTATGTVKDVSAKNNRLVLTIKGQDRAFQLADAAKVRVGEKEARLADVKPGDEVTLTYRMRARAIRSARGLHAGGRVQSISEDRRQLVLKDEAGKEHTFNLNKDARVRLADKEAKLADLKVGDHVVIRYAKDGDQLTAQWIGAHRREHGMRHARGEIKSVASGKNQLVVKDARGQERTFNLASDAKVRVGDKEGKLADLKEGDEVNVTYQAMATNIRATRRE